MTAFGKYIFLYNTLDEKIKDLNFIYPVIKKATKVKSIPARGHSTEMVVDTTYQGDVSFYFEDDPATLFTFSFPDVKNPKPVNVSNYDHFNLYLRIEHKDGKRILLLDETRECYKD